MREKILYFLEQDARIDINELAVMLSADAETVKKEVEAMIDEQVICGFNTLINWDKTDRDFVTALIEVKVTPQRDEGFDRIAKRIFQFEEVTACYLMSGGFDLTVIIEGKSIKDVAFFVSNKLSILESVQGTATHFVLKKYKDHGVVIEKDNDKDGRMIVSP